MKHCKSDAFRTGFGYSFHMDHELSYVNGNIISSPDSSRILRIVVHRDESGYGMTVSGDNPVYVQSVKGGGAAEKSGLHIGDKIIKVNGVNVMQSTHTEVVALIRSSSQAVLTVQQKTLSPVIFEPIRRMSGGSPGPHQNRHSISSMSNTNSNSRITGPRPVDHEKLRQLEFERVHTFRLMLEEEQRYVDSLRSDLAKYSDTKKIKELNNAERRVRKLQEQLQSLISNQNEKILAQNLVQNESYSSKVSPSTSIHNCSTLPCTASLVTANNKSAQNNHQSYTKQLPSHHCSTNYHSRSNSLSPENSFAGKQSPKHSNTIEMYKHPSDAVTVPPPLPKRNRDMQGYCEIVTTTCLDDLVDLSTPIPSPTDLSNNNCEIPPPLPPRNANMLTPETDSSNSLNKQMSFPLVSVCTTIMDNYPLKSPNSRTKLNQNEALKSPHVSCRQTICTGELSQGHRCVSESMVDLNHAICFENASWNTHATPPGTPPPPYPSQHNYVNNRFSDENSELLMAEDIHEITASHLSTGSPIIAASSNMTQQPIISMEDDEMSDQEMNQFDDHGPFKSLNKLWQNTAHLAVFTNYVLSNSDPCSLLFYLLTDLYKEGSAKEMRKWAYEIHSCFLVPGAPLRLNNVDENIAREIDEVLLKEYDKEEIMRRIFWKARNRAKEELNEQLADFQQKRTAGLGTIFGPPDSKLNEISNDKAKASKLFEELLLAKLDPYLEELEKEFGNSRKCLLASAIATVISKTFGVRPTGPQSALNRCPTFISKGKSLKSKLIGRNYRKIIVYGHHYMVQQYYSVLTCNHCHQIIFGVGPQGYQCSVCLINLHRSCVNFYKDYCPGPINKKDRGIGKLMDRIRPEHKETRQKKQQHTIASLINNTVSGVNIINHIEQEKKHSDDGPKEGSVELDVVTVDKPNISISRAASDRRPDVVSEEPVNNNSNHDPSQAPETSELSAQDSFNIPRTRSAQSSINRSESYKEQSQKRNQIRERRKISDPNLSKTTNVSNTDSENHSLLNNTNSGSSSNSSLSSRSFDSPSISCDTFNSNNQVQPPLGNSWDSDIEIEPDPPDWHRFVPEEILTKLHPFEKKRQEVINELFHTEKSHVRNLRVLETVFYRPLLSSKCLPVEQVKLLFSNLEEMIEIHSSLNAAMKLQRKGNVIIGDVGDLLLDMFDGSAGEEFQRAAATFCSRQQIALESLKERRRKDQKLNTFLTECESDKLCKRLQLKDIIPTGMLRLTKYPLLFESLVRYTEQVLEVSSNESINAAAVVETDNRPCIDSDQNANHHLATQTHNQNISNLSPVIFFGPSQVELPKLRRAVERSKEILNFVNQAVKEAEDFARLQDVQKRLDKTVFEKVDHPIAIEFRNLDLTEHKLIHEGPLTWRIGKQKIGLHVLLLEDIIILFQKQDEKFILKFYSSSIERTPQLSPIVKISTVLVRSNAVDKDSLFLVNTSHVGAQIYDLVASSPNDSATWFRHISEAAEAHKIKEGKSRQSEIQSTDFQCTADNVENNLADIVPSNIDNDRLSAIVTKDSVNDEVIIVKTSPAISTANNTVIDNDGAVASDNPCESDKTFFEKMESNPDISNVGGKGSFLPNSTGLKQIVSGSYVTNDNSLIAPCDVVVDLKPVFTAQPILTNIEKVKRKDDLVRKTLLEKRSLVAEILQIPYEEFDTIVDIAGNLEDGQYREPIEIVLVAINKVNALLSLINEASNVTEVDQVVATSTTATSTCTADGNVEQQQQQQQQILDIIPSIPVHKLIDIVNTLNILLTTLLDILKESWRTQKH